MKSKLSFPTNAHSHVARKLIGKCVIFRIALAKSGNANVLLTTQAGFFVKLDPHPEKKNTLQM